jgi:hypothetical protein
VHNKNNHGSKVVKLSLKAVPERKKDSWHGRDNWFYEDEPGVFVECNTTYKNWQDPTSGVEYYNTSHKYYIKDGIFYKEDYFAIAYAPGSTQRHHGGYRGRNETVIKYREPTEDRLFGVTENGGRYRIEYNTFAKEK